jgi:uncharacterized membrane protein YfcA
MSLGAIVMASAASHFGRASSPAMVRKAFATLLLIVATFTLIQSLIV